MTVLPNDPVMLLSYINTRLRDRYSSLHMLCEDMDISETSVVDKLLQIDYTYDVQINQFR